MSKAGAPRSRARVVKEVGDRLRFLVDVGLDY
jgi:excinuclease UvrABC ATPase subunit